MAKYTIQFACGHSDEKQLYGSTSERDSYRAWAAREGECATCRTKAKDLACEAIEAEHEMPELTGSDKQIAWARQIRADKIAAIADLNAKGRARCPAEKHAQFDEMARRVMAALYAKTEAKWWIDRKDTSPEVLIQAAFKEARA